MAWLTMLGNDLEQWLEF